MGCPYKVRANEPFYPADVYPLRRAGEATALARGKEPSDGGGNLPMLPEGPTGWRRRGCWNNK